MMTKRMKIRQQIRSARVSALSEEERRQEMRDAQERWADEPARAEPVAPVVPPGSSCPDTPGVRSGGG